MFVYNRCHMKWRFLSATQDTDHPFLNLFTLHYEVEKDDGTKSPYSYFVASRNGIDSIKAKTRDYSHADGVVLALYSLDMETHEVSVMMTRQFRPALGGYMVSFPAGLLDPDDQDDFEAASREAKEEAGALISSWEVLCPPCPTSSGLSDELDSLLLGRIESLEENRLEEFEDISCSLIPLKTIAQWLKDPTHYVIPMMARITLLYLLERFSVHE